MRTCLSLSQGRIHLPVYPWKSDTPHQLFFSYLPSPILANARLLSLLSPVNHWGHDAMTVTLMLCTMTLVMARKDRHLPRGQLLHIWNNFTCIHFWWMFLWVASRAGPNCLRQSGAGQSSYAGLLYLAVVGARHSNSAEFYNEQTGSEALKQQYNVWLLFKRKPSVLKPLLCQSFSQDIWSRKYDDAYIA